VGVHRQSCRSSILDPLNVTPCTHLVRIPCAVHAKCDTRSPILVSFRPPRLANAMDPHNQLCCKRQYWPQHGVQIQPSSSFSLRPSHCLHPAVNDMLVTDVACEQAPSAALCVPLLMWAYTGAALLGAWLGNKHVSRSTSSVGTAVLNIWLTLLSSVCAGQCQCTAATATCRHAVVIC
jgi:hypothetical protein